MANSMGFMEAQALGSGVLGALASIPAGADAVRLRVELATCRWLEGATPNASVGLIITPADPPILIAGTKLSSLRLYPLVAAQFNVEYFQGADLFRL